MQTKSGKRSENFAIVLQQGATVENENYWHRRSREFSHNRLLLQFIEKKFSDLFKFEILEIKDIPMFNQDEEQS